MGELPRGHGFDPGKAQEASRSIPKATCLKVRLATRQQGFRLLPQAKHEVTGRLSPRQRRRLARPGLYAMDIADLVARLVMGPLGQGQGFRRSQVGPMVRVSLPVARLFRGARSGQHR